MSYELLEFVSKHREDIRDMTYDDFKRKHVRATLLGEKQFKYAFDLYKTHPWLNYAAQPVIVPEGHNLLDYVSSIEVHPVTYVMAPKSESLPKSPAVHRVYFQAREVEALETILRNNTVVMSIKVDIDAGVRPTNWTTLEFKPWYEGYGLLLLNTDVCATGWLGFCTVDSIINEVRKAYAKDAR